MLRRPLEEFEKVHEQLQYSISAEVVGASSHVRGTGPRSCMMGLSRAMDTARARSAAFQGRVGRREAHVLHVPPQCVDTDAKLSREQCQRLGHWQPMEGVRAAIGGPASLELLRARQRSVAAAVVRLLAKCQMTQLYKRIYIRSII